VEVVSKQEKSPFLTALAPAAKQLGNARWGKLRANAFAQLDDLGLPTTKHEDWKYTNLQSVARTAFTPVVAGTALPALASVQQHFLPGTSSTRLTFVDGRFASELSQLPAAAKGISISALSAVSGELENIAGNSIAKLAGIDEQPLHALNTAFFQDGAIIHAAAGATAEQPIHLLFISTGNQRAALIPVRNLIVAEEGSRLEVIETYSGPDGAEYLSSSVTEVFVGPRANVDHTKVQREGDAAHHFGSLAVEQGDASRFASHAFSFGGKLVRNEIAPILNGEQIESFLNGLTVIGDAQHVDNTTVIDHAKPNCFSRELYKGIYADQSSGVFSGTIIVREDAQKTNAIQSNKTLLLSPDATIDTRPQLKIYADDVKCTHGATVGQLDDDALFYLRSRGISRNDARNMLIHAFAGDIIQYVPSDAVRTLLEAALLARLNESVMIA